MKGKRKTHTPPFMAHVTLVALRADPTVHELAGHFCVHPNLSHAWKKQLLAGAEAVFANGLKTLTEDAEPRQDELFEQIERLKMKLEWVKKSCPLRPTAVWIGAPDWRGGQRRPEG